MKTILVLFLFSFTSFVFKTNEVNRLKHEAKKMYDDKRFLDAVKLYTQLETEYKINEPQLIYNHANACYKSLQLKTALKYYKVIAEGKDSTLASHALNQMGIISCRFSQLKEGQHLFMEALRKDASNTSAILNLEWALAQKDLPKSNASSDKEKEQRKNKKKSKTDKGKNEEDKTDPEGNKDKNDALRSEHHQNKYMDMNKARLLLESMKNSEKQYIQQRPSLNTPNTNEPAW
jgi:hypothetical protein